MITTRTSLSTTLLAILLAGMTACGGGSSSSSTGPTPVTPSPNPTPGSGFSFRLDGNQITGTNVTAAFANGILSIGGGNSASNTVLSFAITPTSAGVGTYTLGPLSSANALLLVGNPAQGWNAGVGIGSGSITLNTFTSTSASGTFSFSLSPQPGASGTRSVTEGTFNVTFTAAPTLPPTPSTSSISALVEGVPWSGSLSRRATLGSGFLLLTGQDSNLRVISLGLQVSNSLLIPPSLASIFSLDFNPGVSGVATMTLGASNWDNGHPGGAGTATITALSATHVTGNFTVTLVNNPLNVVTMPTVHLTNGQFDMTLERF